MLRSTECTWTWHPSSALLYHEDYVVCLGSALSLRSGMRKLVEFRSNLGGTIVGLLMAQSISENHTFRLLNICNYKQTPSTARWSCFAFTRREDAFLFCRGREGGKAGNRHKSCVSGWSKKLSSVNLRTYWRLQSFTAVHVIFSFIVVVMEADFAVCCPSSVL